MSSIDNRIVSMTFDNESFERKMAATLASLDKLSEALALAGAREGLTEVNKAAAAFNESGMASAVENISDKFSILGAIGFTVIQDLTRSAIGFVKKLGGDILEPILGGGRQRAANIEQAKFLFRGLGMDVEQGMESARLAVTGTAYGLDSAAKAAAQLGGSGLQAGDDMTSALRGIAGIAAMTNTSYDEMADIFIAAAGKGKVMSMELGRISHRGVNAAAALAKVWGITEQEVRQMATEGEISFEMFYQAMDEAFGEHAQKANETYAGSLANVRAALGRVGASFYGPHMEKQRDLFNSMSPVIDDVNEALQPLIKTILNLKGAATDRLISFFDNIDLGNFTEAIPNFAASLRQTFGALGQFMGTIREAFREIFPKSETSKLVAFSEALLEFTKKLKMGGETAESVKSIFRGIFSVFSIGFEIIKGLARLFLDLGGAIADALGFDGGGFLRFFGNLGESLVSVKEALVDGGGIKRFFENLSDVIKDPIRAIGRFKDAIGNLFSGGEIPGSGVASSILERLGERFGMLATAASKVKDVFRGIGDFLRPVIDYIKNWFSELGGKLASSIKEKDFSAVLDTINVALLGGIALILKRFLKGGMNVDFGGGFIENITGIFGGLKGTLEAMQTDLKASALMKIAGAVAILTVAVVALSMIDSAALTKALIAIAVGFAQLSGAMAIMTQMTVGTQAAKLTVLATGMMVLAGAAVILSIAIKNLSSLSWEELAKGLIGVTVALVALTGSTQLITANTKGLVRAGISMMIISTALIILAKAVKSFAEMSWGDMARGLAGAAGGLVALAGAMHIMPKGMLLQSASIIAIAVGLRILANAVAAFADIPKEDLARGMFGIGGGLVVIAGAMHLMPGNMLLTGAGLIAVSIGLRIMAGAVRAMGAMELEQLAKGIGAIGVTLGVLAGGLKLMSGGLAGAAALTVTAIGLGMMAKVLKAFSKMSITEIVTGLAAVAGVFVVLGVSSLLLAKLTPVMFTLGAALSVLGIAFALFGVGAILVAKSFEIMARSGKAGMEGILGAIKVLIKALPEIVKAIVAALVDMAKAFLDAAPILIEALGIVLIQFLETIAEVIPAAVETFSLLISEVLTMMRERGPEFIETGLTLLLALLKGIDENIEEISERAISILTQFINTLAENANMLVDAAVNLITSFLNALTERAGELVTAGMELLKALLKGIADNIGDVADAVGDIITEFIAAVGRNLRRIVDAGFDLIEDFLEGIGNGIGDIADVVWAIVTQFTEDMLDNADRFIKSGGKALVKFLDGVAEAIPLVIISAVNVVIAFINAIGAAALMLVNAAMQMILDFVNGIADAIEEYAPEFRKAGARIAWHIFDGMGFGVPGKVDTFVGGVKQATISNLVNQDFSDISRAAQGVGTATMTGAAAGVQATAWVLDAAIRAAARSAISIAMEVIGASSPSKVFMKIGGYMVQGMALGLGETDPVDRKAAGLAQGAINSVKDALKKVPDILSGMDDFNPVITPVLDLSTIESDSKKLGSLIGSAAIVPDMTRSRARHISATAVLNPERVQEPTYTGPKEVTFEQNIYAPEALSTNDIYRNTKSQIAVAKEELGLS
jgi:tape measure domain-containing protein